MIPLDPNLRVPISGTVVALPTEGAERIEGDLLKALVQAGKVEARVLQVLNQSALIDFLDLGSARVRTEVPLRAGDVFTAMVEPREGRPTEEPVRLRIAELRHEPAAPMKAERLAGQLSEMGLSTDAKHQAMARALLRHAGTVSREAMAQLNDALNRLSGKSLERPSPTSPERAAPETALPREPGARSELSVKRLDAVAFLIARKLPVEERTVAWVMNRLNAPTTSGERLAAIARQLPDASTPAAQALLALEVPDGDAAQTAEHLFKLTRAFTAPEARIARVLEEGATPRRVESPADESRPSEAREAGLPKPPQGERSEARPAQPLEPARSETAIRPLPEPLLKIQEALTSVLERALRSAEGTEPIREALSEVRFGQLVNVAAADPQHANAERSLALPLWWSGGSGEIRVRYQARDGKKGSGGEPSETRVVVTLDTRHLQRVRVDLLLGKKQLNCQVAVEDEAIVKTLSERLPELREALESVGIRVNALGVKHSAPKEAVVEPALRQVDVWL